MGTHDSLFSDLPIHVSASLPKNYLAIGYPGRPESFVSITIDSQSDSPPVEVTKITTKWEPQNLCSEISVDALSDAERKIMADTMKLFVETDSRWTGSATENAPSPETSLTTEDVSKMCDKVLGERNEMDTKLFVGLLKAGIRITVGAWASPEYSDEMTLVIPKSKKALLKQAQNRVWKEMQKAPPSPWFSMASWDLRP